MPHPTPLLPNEQRQTIGMSAFTRLSLISLPRWTRARGPSTSRTVVRSRQVQLLPQRRNDRRHDPHEAGAVHYALERLLTAGLIRREVQRGKPTIYHLLGSANSCTPTDSGCAESCGTGVQESAGRCARICGTGVQESAAEVNKEKKTQETNEVKKTKRGKAAAGIPAGLLELIDGWNGLADGIVRNGNSARRDPPAQASLSGWKKAAKNPEQAPFLADIPAVLAAIRGAKFCHGQGWFDVPWLFGRNKNAEFNIVRLMAGAYNGDNGHASRNGTSEHRNGAGQRFTPGAAVTSL